MMSEYKKPSIFSDTSGDGDISPTGLAFPFAANAVVVANAAIVANAIWAGNVYIAGNGVGAVNAAVITKYTAFTSKNWAGT